MGLGVSSEPQKTNGAKNEGQTESIWDLMGTGKGNEPSLRGLVWFPSVKGEARGSVLWIPVDRRRRRKGCVWYMCGWRGKQRGKEICMIITETSGS